ncbi:MAG: 30S ribosomal protein S4e [Candidatus Thermoplasmatota archaeon]|nr:30S ribosomal protein S4e [Candidatus Thermoplasmatota archaeon]
MSKHLKRLAAPKTWKISRKGKVWVVKPRCSPHPIQRSYPLLLIIRDFLHYGDTAKDCKRIVARGEILVDCKEAKDHKRAVGLMDVLSIPKLQEQYRVVVDSKGKLALVRIAHEESNWKLVRIENKTTIKGGKTQLNLHDSRNIILDKNAYKTGDTLKIELPSQKILDCYKLENENLALIIGGKHSGKIAKIVSYETTKSPQPNIVHLENFSTTKDYVFVIGRDKPEINLPEVSAIE